MKVMNIATRYSGFAVIATLLNLLTQEVSLQIYAGFLDVYIGIFVGTIVGLMCKYYLDKQFIFSYQTQSSAYDAQTFFAYSLTGIGPTLLFWMMEVGFDLIYGTKTARYVGAVIGLTIGYVVKYQLDKHYVFSKQDI